MSKIIKRLNPEVIKRTAARCRERGIVLPTFAQLRNPDLIPPAIRRKLKGVGLWDVRVELAVLTLFAAVFFVIGAWLFDGNKERTTWA